MKTSQKKPFSKTYHKKQIDIHKEPNIDLLMYFSNSCNYSQLYHTCYINQQNHVNITTY